MTNFGWQDPAWMAAREAQAVMTQLRTERQLKPVWGRFLNPLPPQRPILDVIAASMERRGQPGSSFSWGPSTAQLPLTRSEVDEKQGKSSVKWSGIMGDAIIQSWTAGGFLDMVKQSNWPWWWGTVRGWADIDRNIRLDIERARENRFLPQGAKNMAIANLNLAWAWANENWGGRRPI